MNFNQHTLSHFDLKNSSSKSGTLFIRWVSSVNGGTHMNYLRAYIM